MRSKNIKVPVSHAVCFPSAREDEFPQSAELSPDIIIGRNRINQLERALIDIAVKSQPEKFRMKTHCAIEKIRVICGKWLAFGREYDRTGAKDDDA